MPEIDPPAQRLGAALRLARRARGMKQSHTAELLGIGQPLVSRIESGEAEPGVRLRDAILDLVAARLDPAHDAGLRRLVEGASAPVHLVCDVTHRLLAASSARECEWQRSAAELRGQSLWRYASGDIRAAEATLPDLGWAEADGTHTLVFVTAGHRSDALRIAAGRLTWDRILLSGGTPARIVTGVADPA